MSDPGGKAWAVILAGGRGVRLRRLTRLVCGDDRPKQFASLLGAQSLLRATLDRVGVAIPSDRAVVVAHADHARHLGDDPRPPSRAVPETVSWSDRGTPDRVRRGLRLARIAPPWPSDAERHGAAIAPGRSQGGAAG